MSVATFNELKQLIENFSIPLNEKSVLVNSLNKLHDPDVGSEEARVTFRRVFALATELSPPTTIALEVLSFYLAKFPGQEHVFSVFQYYCKAWHCLPELLKSNPDGDKSGLLERVVSQLKASYGSLLPLFSTKNSRPALVDATSGENGVARGSFRLYREFHSPDRYYKFKACRGFSSS